MTEICDICLADSTNTDIWTKLKHMQTYHKRYKLNTKHFKTLRENK